VLKEYADFLGSNEEVVEHLREYLEDLQDELQGTSDSRTLNNN
jgi:hypothetical protein